ncbi:small, acid-soluble spore protein K [Siminovitchia sp. 179-K 8D1 HS]|uniref:small, acid-soluble spore protein K n=1 Tax=Siminovitchia sp. 179-K 8D1 HS TaxID=3142385 RepID=UPI00399EF312
MRNKAKHFPYENKNQPDLDPRAKAAFASKRADGTTNTKPQERMRASGAREDNRGE